MKHNHTTGALVDGKLRTINEFSELDRKLDFLCPKCKEQLILRLYKTRNQSHFAHKPESNCTGAQESAYHLMAKEVLSEFKNIYSPEIEFDTKNDLVENDYFKDEKFRFLYSWGNAEIYELIQLYDNLDFKEFNFSSKIWHKIKPIQPKSILGRLLSFHKIEIEDFDEQKSIFFKKYGFIPDAIGYINDKVGQERALVIEFLYSHKVDEEKLKKIKEQNLPCIEIDISRLELNRFTFINYLGNEGIKAVYLNNPRVNKTRTDFLKLIEEKVIEVVDLIKSDIQKKENEIDALKELNYVQIPSGFGFNMERFCSRNSEKKQEYKKTKFYNDPIVKEVIDNGWNLGRDYDRHSYYESVTGITLYKKDNKSLKFKKLSKNFREFYSDYYKKIWSTHGCNDCNFYKEVDKDNRFCGAPDVNQKNNPVIKDR